MNKKATTMMKELGKEWSSMTEQQKLSYFQFAEEGKLYLWGFRNTQLYSEIAFNLIFYRQEAI